MLKEEMLVYRALHKLSQGKAAELAGITKQTWYSIENGYQNPSKVTEAKIRILIEKETNESIN